MRCSRRAPARTHAFTLIEAIVLIAVGFLLIGLLIPAVGASRERARSIECASRAQQLGLAINLYLSDSAGCLPQVLRTDPDRAGSQPEVCPSLFGGKAGALTLEGVDRFGIADRPLNRYVVQSGTPSDAGQIEAFHSPSDRGGTLPTAGRVESMYDAVGSSYTLNTRLLRSSAASAPVATLVPLQGGPMPKIENPAITWLLGSHPILNHDAGFDRGFIWYGKGRVRATLLMADLHVARLINVAPGVVQTTGSYTFKPSREWPEQ